MIFLSLPVSATATRRFLSRFISARVAPRALLGGPRGVPGVVSSSHPLFHPRTAPARPGDVPLAHPRVLSFCLPDHPPSCGCPLGLSSVHATLLRPHSPLIMLLRQRWPSLSPVTRFSSLSLFSISSARLFYRPSSSSRARLLSHRTIHVLRIHEAALPQDTKFFGRTLTTDRI